MNEIIKEFLKNNKVNFSIIGTHSFIYIIESANLYKIGFARNLDGRINVIKTSSPHEVKLIYLIPLTSEIEHKKVENALHKMFESSHIKGEWFNLSMGDIAKIRSLSIQNILTFADKIEKQAPEDQISFFPPEDKR